MTFDSGLAPRKVALSIALASVATASNAQVNETDDQVQDSTGFLGTLILFTDRIGQTILDLPSSVTVFDDATIEERQITNMQDLVRNVPGVEVPRQTSAADPFSTFNGFTIRGVGGNRVAIQVDGSRVPERIIDGTRDYLDFNFTKQAEIVRGPASILWGADALGGLVALETKDPEDLLNGRTSGGEVGATYDSFDDAAGVNFSYAYRFSDQLSAMIGVAHDTAHEPELSNAKGDGGDWGCGRNVDVGATDCGTFDPMNVTSDRLLGKLVWTPNTDHRVEFSMDLLDRVSEVEQNYILGDQYSSFTGLPTGEVIHDKDRTLDLTRRRFGVEHLWTPQGGFVDELKTTFAYTPNSYERTGTETSTSASGESIRSKDYLSYSEDFFELDLQATKRFALGGTDHTLVFGFDGDIAESDYARKDTEYNLTTGITTITRAGGFNFANATTTRADVYIQDRISFGGGRFELTPGLRFATYRIDPRADSDYQEVAGQEPETREDQRLLKSLGAIYHLSDTWSVWGKYDEGFKMPTAQQLYTSLPGAFFNLTPAPGLEPEEVKSYEIGLRYQEDRGFVAVTGFKSEYTDFIQSFYNPPGTSDYTYRNLSTVDVWGIEASAGWMLSDVTELGFSAAWQEGEQKVNSDSDTTPHTLPPLTATVSLRHELPRYGLELEGVATFAGDVKRTANDSDFKPKGYGLLDLYARYEVARNVHFNVGVQNVFDERYFTANAATYGTTASASVARSNPIELQTGPGRTVQFGLNMTF